MSIANRTSASHPALASIPADLLHTATGGASPVLLPNGEPNGVLVGGPAPVSPPQPLPVSQGEVFARENAQAELQQWANNTQFLVDAKKAGWFDLGRPY